MLTAQIKARFGMSIDHLKAAATAAPTANSDATDIVKWHGMLLESQATLDRAEDALVAALESQPSEVDDPTMELAHRVNKAVAVRDGRAMVVRWLLDPNTVGKHGLAARLLTRFGQRQGPAVPTTAPPRPATAPQPGRNLAR
ncbi:hypothetical protein [Streptomyces sp. NPDC017673]|uniref:hypothetical protein n=1 Tax=unclassified Streptomyces TaxID=2593676 RepID=UPI0037BBB277